MINPYEFTDEDYDRMAGDSDARLEMRQAQGKPSHVKLSPELIELKRVMKQNSEQPAGNVPEKLIHYIANQIDKVIGKPMRLEFFRWVFDRPEISTSSVLDPDNTGYDGELFPGEAEALRLWAIPYKGTGVGEKWQLLNPLFTSQLNRFLVEVMGQMKMDSLEQNYPPKNESSLE